jgi:hypothetical protein
MGHKNDYSVIVFLSSGDVKKWEHIHKLYGFARFLDNKYSDWLYMNVYDRRNRQYLKRFYKGKYVPDFI